VLFHRLQLRFDWPQPTTLQVENPSDRSVVTRVAEGGPADIELALDAAHRVHAAGTWRNMDPRARAKILEKAAEILSTRIESIAALESLQTGRPIKEMTAQLRRLPEWFQYFAALIRTQEGTCPPFLGNYLNYVRRVPLGVVAQITPWNHPLLISIKKLAPAIATGNCVVMKPSELAPVAPLLLARILHEAGLPNGVFNVVSGLGPAAGAALCGSPRVKLVDLTGGTPTGRIVAAAAGRSLASCVMELGGKAPVIVFDDADVDNAVNGAAFAAFIASGQTCIAGSRLLVHTDIYEEFTAKLIAKVKSIKIGLPSDISTQLGPVICGPQLNKIDGMCRQAEQEGATILTGGKRVMTEPFSGGYYFEPTVIAVNTHHTVWREEVFGPVTVIIRFGSEDEAVCRCICV
jgi:phenylacetaldehyde dehydrogenase